MDFEIQRKKGFFCIGGPAFLGGICSAIAEKQDIEVWKVRVITMLFGKIATLFYIIGWVVLDKEG